MTTRRHAESGAAPRRPSEGELVRAVGTVGLTAGIVNITIGGGIFRVPAAPDVAGALGPAAPIAYIVCAIAMGLIVLCIAEAGSRVSLTGGPYAYVETAFGPLAGFIVGVLLWLGGTSAMAAVATIFTDNVVRAVPALAGTWSSLLLLVVVAGLVLVHVLGIRQGTRFNIVATAVKLVPLALLAIVGLTAIDPANLRWETTPRLPEVTRASVFLIFVFAGIESALVPSGEVHDPARTVPRAVFLGMAIVTLIYIWLQLVAQGTLGHALAGSSTPLADAAGRILGGYGAWMLTYAVILSTFGYLSGMLLAMPRALFAFARDGFLPSVVASIHPRTRTPYVSIVLQGIIVLALVAGNTFERLVILSGVAALLVYLGCAGAAWQLRRANVQQGGVPFRMPGGSIAPVLASAVILFMFTSVTAREWSLLGVVVLVTIGIYAVTQPHRSRLRA